MSKSEGIVVSREVLETMLEAVTGTREALPTVFAGEPFEQGQKAQRLITKLMDIQIALEALCARQS